MFCHDAVVIPKRARPSTAPCVPSGKHCFKGHCIWLTPDILKQDGNWGMWSKFGELFPDLLGRGPLPYPPVPANGGHTCYGPNYEFQLCNAEECANLFSDYREDQCRLWDPTFEYQNAKHHWLPFEHSGFGCFLLAGVSGQSSETVHICAARSSLSAMFLCCNVRLVRVTNPAWTRETEAPVPRQRIRQELTGTPPADPASFRLSFRNPGARRMNPSPSGTPPLNELVCSCLNRGARSSAEPHPDAGRSAQRSQPRGRGVCVCGRPAHKLTRHSSSVSSHFLLRERDFPALSLDGANLADFHMTGGGDGTLALSSPWARSPAGPGEPSAWRWLREGRGSQRAKERCHLHCQSKETGAKVDMQRMVYDGTPCSYKDPYSICMRGDCVKVGCDQAIGSTQQEDKCGICGGDNSSCKIVKGNFHRSAKKQGFLKILEIPRGARHLLIQEFKGTPHIIAVKNQATGHIFLNGEGEFPDSRSVIEKGVEWEYENEDDKESVQTTGPLKYGVVIMIRSQGDSKVTLSYKYIIHKELQSFIENNVLQEDSSFYEWSLKKWSHCSKPCGGGKQYTRYGCRRKSDSKMVHRVNCENIKKPQAVSRDCNQKECSLPIWVIGDWESCSKSCASTATMTGPEARRACNRQLCPAQWRVGPWSQCSVTCANGTQERQVLCHTRDNTIGLCLDAKPETIRACKLSSCPKSSSDHKNGNFLIQWLSRPDPEFPIQKISSRQRCYGDRSVFCRMEVLSRYCSIPGYRQMCCKSCSEGNYTVRVNGTSFRRKYTTPPSDVVRNYTTVPTHTATEYSPAPKYTTGNYTTDPSTTFSVIGTTDPSIPFSDEDTTVSSTAAAEEDSTDPGSSISFDYTTVPSSTGSSDDVIMASTIITSRDITVVSPITSGWFDVTHTPQPTFSPTAKKSRKATTPATTTVTTAPSRATGGPITATRLPNRTEEVRENNSIDVPYRIIGVDNVEVSQNNFIPRRRRLYRERTRNKRIQELLAEKRETLRRMRRGPSA
ncbi:hypothetical protein SKAU_G00365190 [Synaphobranchus kaupii]|uniref:PLAC domain-containing protein n=1 Tax=Synaphobranchus kaupii TaxID=118154 RepID=A0A9Q1EEY7_SYNKA|nr:hypothetical protein SKAU_G00365190 [Synaphobranchus kaupii]